MAAGRRSGPCLLRVRLRGRRARPGRGPAPGHGRDRRFGRPPDSGSEHRSRFSIGNADEALRSPQPRARTCHGHHHAARPRRARRTVVGTGWRPPPHPVQLSKRHPRYRLPRLGAPDFGRRTVPVSAVARPRSPDCRRRNSGELRRQRLHLRGHRRARVRRLQLRLRRSRRRERLLGPRRGRCAPPGLASRVAPQGHVSRVSARRLDRPQGLARRRQRRGLQPPQREAEGLHSAPPRADRDDLDGHGIRDDQCAREEPHRACC